jgi:hypothetical protein
MDTTVKGQVDGVAAGTSYIQAAYSGYNYYWNGYSCLNSPVNGDGYATMNMCNSGVPDHLEVVSDGFHYVSCTVGQNVERDITYAVMDGNNNYVTGTIPVSEALNFTSKNSCFNAYPTPQACADTNVAGEFPDHISTACNAVGGHCGFTMNQQWHWCPSSFAGVAIATLPDDGVYFNSSTVLNHTVPPDSGRIPDGTDVYP